MNKLALVLILGSLASGCVTTRAQTQVERPVLDVPPAPPRVIEPAPLPEVVQLPEPAEEQPPAPVVQNTSRRTATREAQRETQKPEPKTETAPVTEPPAPTPPPAPAPLLRTPATADAAAAERQIRETLYKAQDGLNRVDFQNLPETRKKSYNEAKEIIRQAEEAIKVSNLDLAKGLASTAEKLVNALQGR
jgi:hypothetical protein